MLLGDPNEFAVLLKTIDEWNYDNTFCNGILLLFVDGYMFPSEEIIVTTLAHGIPELKNNLSEIVVDNSIFNMEKTLLFRKLYDCVYPNDVNKDNDYRFLITPEEISDKGFFIFAVSNGAQIRFLGSKLTYNEADSDYDRKKAVIRETFVDKSDINKIVCDLDCWQIANSIV